MTSPRPSLSSSTSVVSTSSSDGESPEEEAVSVPQPLEPPTTTQNTVTVGGIKMKKDAQVPGVLLGNFNKTHFNFFINRTGDVGDVDVNELATDAVKVNSATVKPYLPYDFNSSSYKLTGTKEDVEGLSRRWCYLITSLVILSLITLLGTAVLSLTSWRTSQGPALTPAITPAIQVTMDGLSSEEKKFAGLPHGPRIVTRAMWRAVPPRMPLDGNTLPAPLVVVCHTATGNCSSQPKCVDKMRAMQRYHQETRGLADLGYNFVIGGDGAVYWSRGFNFEGAHTRGFNPGSIAVAFIGNYVHVEPSQTQIEAFHKLVRVGLQEGKIAADYSLVAQCQLQVTTAPGFALVHLMTSWPHYNSSLPVRCTAV